MPARCAQSERLQNQTHNACSSPRQHAAISTRAHLDALPVALLLLKLHKAAVELPRLALGQVVKRVLVDRPAGQDAG